MNKDAIFEIIDSLYKEFKYTKSYQVPNSNVKAVRRCILEKMKEQKIPAQKLDIYTIIVSFDKDVIIDCK